MSKVFGKFALLFVSALFVCSTAYSQDLGSSSGIFRSPNPSSKSAATKTTKPKSANVKKTAPKPKPVSKSTNNKAARPKTTTTGKRETFPVNTLRQPTIVTPQPQEKIVITVGNPTSGNFEELFEQSVEEGNAARDDRDYPRAEAAYRRALNLNPRDARAVYGLGNIYADQQRWEEAETSYRQSLALDPNEAGALVALSYVLTQPLVVGELSERYEEAEKMARRAIQIDAQNAFAHDQLGVALELRGIISGETLNAYNRAIQIEPEFALAYAHLGRLLHRNGKAKESAEAYRKAIQFSADVPTMILVADVMQSQQKFTESESLLRRAIALDAKNPTALNMLGRALTTRSAFDEAEKVLKKSVEVSPGSFVSYTLLSSLYLRRARLDEAERNLNKALTVVSQNERKRLAQDFEAVGDAFMKARKPLDARRLYRQAQALDATKTNLTEKLAKIR